MPLYLNASTKNITIFLFLFFGFQKAQAQQHDDSIQQIELREVVVKAFEQNRKLKDIPASVAYVNRQMLESFSSSSIVHAVNTQPGIRMEERSPGSYRFNIRGSSLRSPFGVRNIKVYYNDLPYTNPGGHTYLNQLGYYNFGSLEIMKGPGSSLYGAGTGGVLLIESMNENEQPGVFAEYASGSYNLQNLYGAVLCGNKKFKTKTGYQHQQSDGYRDHSALERNVLSWSGNFRFDGKHILKTSFFYGDLFYETPGALTLKEYTINPKNARPRVQLGPSAFIPSAVDMKASVQQKTFLTGASYWQKLTEKFSLKGILYGSYTQLHNPTIQNYGRNSEPHVGGRSLFTYQHTSNRLQLKFDGGAEWQQGFTNVSIHKNVAGGADSIRSYDEITNRLSLLFAQASFDVGGWNFLGGISLNGLNIKYQRFMPQVNQEQSRKFSNELTPRFAILKHLKNFTVYTSISKGFSPPTTEELFPTGGQANIDLKAEEGINYDVGIRATVLNNLNIDLNAFIFSLDNAIVQRRNALGGNFYINAGNTIQKGVETIFNYHILKSSSLLTRSDFWLSHTWHRFRYDDFKKDTNDFSGKALPVSFAKNVSICSTVMRMKVRV